MEILKAEMQLCLNVRERMEVAVSKNDGFLLFNCPVIENVCEEKPLPKKKDFQGTSSSKGVSKFDFCEISPWFLWVT